MYIRIHVYIRVTNVVYEPKCSEIPLAVRS